METVREFGIQPILILAQAVNFLVLLVLLRRFLYRPILKTLSERQARIAQSLQQAEEVEVRLAQTKKEQEKILTAAQNQAQEIIAQAKDSAGTILAEAEIRAKQMALDMVAQGNVRISQEHAAMFAKLKGEIAHLVVLATKAVAGKTLTQRDQEQLVQQAVHKVVSG